MAAVDTDKDYLSYKLVSQPTYGVTGLGNNAPLTTNTDGTTSQVPYDPPNPPVSDSFRVSVTDKRDGHTREALISIVGPTPGPTIPSAVDDLAYAVSGNTITLSWSHPDDGGSEITHYKIERSTDTDTWSLVNTVSETSTSYTITGQPGYAKYHRIFAYNSIGQSASSNVIQPRIIDTSPPVITINTPATDQVITSQSIPVTSNIFEYDDSGIENVQMTMDHVLTTDPISVSRIGIVTATATSEITGVDNGQRTLTVRATNGDGYIGSKSVSFTKNTPTSQNLASFEDDFEGDIAPNWHTTTEDDENWDIRNPSRTIPDSATGNKVVGTEDCDNKCELVMIHTVDTSAMTEPKLSFYRYLSSSLDSGEGLDVSVSTDGGTTFTVLDSFTAEDAEDDNTWHFEEYGLANYASTQFKLKFVATSSSNSEDTEIDALRIYDAYIPADTTPPVFTVVPPNITTTIPAAGGGDSVTVTFDIPAATDNEGTVNVSCDPSSGSTFGVGTTKVICTATDTAGNSSDISFSVTVIADSVIPPPISVPNNAPILIVTPLSQTATSGDTVIINATVSDPDGDTVTVVWDPYTNVDVVFEESDDGLSASIEVPYHPTHESVTVYTQVIATDEHGASTTVTSRVIMSLSSVPADTTPPVFSVVPPNITTTIPAGGGGGDSVTVTFDLPTATDNEGTVNVSCDPSSGSTFDVGTTTVMCIATDSAENSSVISFYVTVTTATPPLNPVPNRDPIVTITSIPENPVSGDTVILYATVHDPDGDPVSVTWELYNSIDVIFEVSGDGLSASFEAPYHPTRERENGTLVVTATDSHQASTTVFYTVRMGLTSE